MKDTHALAYFQEKVTSDFWDKPWKTYDLRNSLLGCTTDGVFIPLVKKYLPTRSTVLEAYIPHPFKDVSGIFSPYFFIA